jgi:hypothetical protein
MTRGFYRLNEDGSVDRVNTIRNSDGYWDEKKRGNPPLGFVWAETPAEAFELLIPRPHAERWQIRVWLSRQGVNPAMVSQLIESMTEDGPERWEALSRWESVTVVPMDHPMVGLLWQHIGPMLEPQRTLEQAWEEILAR